MIQDEQPTSGNGGRINVSEDRLVRVVLESEVRLRDFIDARVTTKADADDLIAAEKKILGLDVRVANLEKWRYALGFLGATALSVAAIVAKHSHLF